MNLKEAYKVLESLQELSVDVEDFSWGPSYEFARDRQKEAIKIIKDVIKELEHQKLKDGVGAGMLDSIEPCPECEDGIVISKMAGGYHCNKCDYGEIAF